MSIRRTRQLLWLTAAFALIGCGLATAWAINFQPRLEANADQAHVTNPPDASETQTLPALDAFRGSWDRHLRRPLYDPKPIVRERVEPPPRPIPFKMTGVMLSDDPAQSMAILQSMRSEIATVVAGDAFEGAKILEVQAEKTIVEFDGKRREVQRTED